MEAQNLNPKVDAYSAQAEPFAKPILEDLRKVVKPQKPVPKAPPEFEAALRKSKKASAAFAALSPSCKREYIEWIADAKRPETRDKRIKTAMEWIAEGKQRNRKYP